MFNKKIHNALNLDFCAGEIFDRKVKINSYAKDSWMDCARIACADCVSGPRSISCL